MNLHPGNSTGQEPISPPCYLLGLPRELRNQIYSFLSLDEDGDWKYMSLFLLPFTQIRFHNAPLLSMLHTHPQLRAEYLEVIRDVSITIRMGVEAGPFGSIGSTWGEEDPPLPIDHLFHHFLRHMTILVDCGHARRSAKAPSADMLGPFVRVLVKYAPNLATLKLGLQYHANRRFYHYNHTDPTFTAAFFLAPPLVSLPGYTLVQRGEGYRFDHEEIRGFGPLASPNTPPVRVPAGAPNTGLIHGLVKNGVYLYVCGDGEGEGEWTKRCWSTDEVVALFPVRPYTRGWGIEKDVPWLARHEMREWRERRGVEEAGEWFKP